GALGPRGRRGRAGPAVRPPPRDRACLVAGWCCPPPGTLCGWGRTAGTPCRYQPTGRSCAARPPPSSTACTGTSRSRRRTPGPGGSLYSVCTADGTEIDGPPSVAAVRAAGVQRGTVTIVAHPGRLVAYEEEPTPEPTSS